MNRRAHPLLLATLMVLSVLATSCATTRELRVEPASESGPRTLGTKRQAVTGYTTIDRHHHEFAGIVQLTGDSLRFERNALPTMGIAESPQREVRMVPRDSVISIEGKFVDGTKTALSITVVALALTIALLYAVISSYPFGLGN